MGCSSEKKDWNQTKSINKIERYADFIKEYPESQYVDSAKVLIKEIEKKNRLEKVLATRDIDALKTFVSDSANEDILKRFKIKAGNSITLASQPEKAKKGYKLSLKPSKEHEDFDYLLSIPPNTNVDVDFKEDVHVKIIKGDLLVSIRNGSTAGYLTTNEETTLLIKVKDNRKIILSAEYVNVDSNMFVYLTESEFIITRTESASIRRELLNNSFSLLKGEIYYVKFD
jgi:small nuclear ribonucleoprotein (snRNP)-like protein